MVNFDAPSTAPMIGVSAYTLRKWGRKKWVAPLVERVFDRWIFTPADVALLALTATLADFGMGVPVAYRQARAVLPSVSADDTVEDVIAQASAKRLVVSRAHEVEVVERFPKVAGAALLVDVEGVVRDAFSRQP